MTLKEKLSLAVTTLDKKIAADIIVLKVDEITTLSEYFIICTGTSNTHVRTLSEAVEDALSRKGIEPHHVEGHGGMWVLLDYGSFVIHIFTEEGRRFYQLDKLWADAEHVPTEDLITEQEMK